MSGKWTAKEKLFHVVLIRTVSHEHDELCIVSKICSLAKLWNKISTSLGSSKRLFQSIDWEFLDAPVDKEKPQLTY